MREGLTAEAFPEPQALRGSRLVLGSAPVGATDLFATVENISLAQDLALLPRYAWQTSLQSVREEARIVPSYQLKPKMVGSLGTFDLKSWFSWVSRDLELAMGFYLNKRAVGR